LFFRWGPVLLPGASLRPWSSYLCLLSNQDHRHMPPLLVCFWDQV
jgi:hypothetical protein